MLANEVWQKVGILQDHKGIDFRISHPQVQNTTYTKIDIPEECHIINKNASVMELSFVEICIGFCSVVPWNNFFIERHNETKM